MCFTENPGTLHTYDLQGLAVIRGYTVLVVESAALRAAMDKKRYSLVDASFLASPLQRLGPRLSNSRLCIIHFATAITIAD